jgi:hypothetical protein
MLMLAVLLILLAQSLAADSIRCGRKVVREGVLLFRLLLFRTI